MADPVGDAGTLDGNVLAGPMRDLFAADLTTASCRCAGCGRVEVVARLVVYGPEPGWVARCPGCLAVLFTLVRAPDAAWLDLRGATAIRVPLPS